VAAVWATCTKAAVSYQLSAVSKIKSPARKSGVFTFPNAPIDDLPEGALVAVSGQCLLLTVRPLATILSRCRFSALVLSFLPG